MSSDTIKYIKIGEEEHSIDASCLNGVQGDGYQSKDNLVTSLNSSSKNTEYPSAACLYRIVGDLGLNTESEPEETTYYTLTLTVSPAGYGTITVSGNGPYLPGTSVEITATANPGYVFKNWYQDNSTDATRTVTMNSDMTLTAVFEIYIKEDESTDLDYPDIEDLWDL